MNPRGRSALAQHRATWAITVALTAVVMGVPLMVHLGAMSPYDDPKAWALQGLVGGIAVAWLVLRATGEGSRQGPTVTDRGARLLRWTVLAYGAWWVVTTLASLVPGESIWGSFGRGHGLLLMGAALTLFALLLDDRRAPLPLVPLIDAALLGCVPVCLLALGQAVGWDAFPISWDPAVRGLRVRSTFGQHIFLGSYLVLLIPLAAGRLDAAVTASGPGPSDARRGWWGVTLGGAWVAGAVGLVVLAARWSGASWMLLPWGILGATGWVRLTRDGTARRPRALVAGALGALLAGQVLVVILSRARGPFLGLLVGLGVTTCLLLVRRRVWRGLALAGVALGAVLTFVLLLNLPGSPLAPLRTVPLLARLGAMADMGRSSPGRVRLDLWQGIVAGWRHQLRGAPVVPEASPRLRALVGFGLESQRFVLGRLARWDRASHRTRWHVTQVRYVADRAHNELLDHLVTGGLVGVALWLLAVGGILVLGVARIRAAAGGVEAAIRMGALGAILGHLVEAQFGIATPMARALFWLAAGILVRPPGLERRDPDPSPRPARVSRVRWTRWALPATGAAMLGVVFVGGASRWLWGSIAYTRGVSRSLAADLPTSRVEFREASRLAPWLPLPREALADVTLSLAATLPDPGRRQGILAEAEAGLADARGWTRGAAMPWALTGQVALAQAGAGRPEKIGEAVKALETATRLEPDDPELWAELALAWLQSGNPARAREVAGRAVTVGPGAWLAWAVLGRAAREQGDLAEARLAAARARALAPPDARRLLEAWLP